jgi:Beta-lactamase superfamily domain
MLDLRRARVHAGAGRTLPAVWRVHQLHHPRSRDGADPDLVLDGGTGLRKLGGLLVQPFSGTILLTHLHWNHFQGLPFADALLDPAAVVTVVVPVENGVEPLDALLPAFSLPAFPVRPDELGPSWRFVAARPEARFGDWTVRTRAIRHKGGRTGHPSGDPGSVGGVHARPRCPRGRPARSGARGGADLLIHDAQYLADEMDRYRALGRSTIEWACDFADSAGVGRLVRTHHAPDRTDDQLDVIESKWLTTPSGIPIVVAREGSRLTV